MPRLEEPSSNPKLVARIHSEIASRGPLTFADYMELVLYHPELGYYSSPKPRIGPEGDYYTSLDLSPLFGACLARQLEEMWELLGHPRRFHIVEFGAGKGLMARDILVWALAHSPALYHALEYIIVEISPSLRKAQAERLHDLPVRWCEEAELGHGLVGCVLTNEFVDALPFHRLRVQDGQLQELWIGIAGGKLWEQAGPLSSAVTDCDAVPRPMPEGAVMELRPKGERWLQQQLHRLDRGFVLTIDYGATRDELLRRHPAGTLRCYHRHTLNHDPFRNIGEQDITASVDFSALASAAQEAGGELTGYTLQGHFLASLGIGDLLAGQLEATTDLRVYERERATVAQLVSPEGLGDFKVLIVQKGLPSVGLTGLRLLKLPV